MSEHASAELQPQQALFLRDFIVRSLRSEHPVTRRVIEAVPVDKGDFKPDPVVKSALELAWHIVGAEHRFIDAVLAGAFDFTNAGRPPSWRIGDKISGVFGHKLPRKYSRISVCVSSVKYSVSSSFVFRQVK